MQPGVMRAQKREIQISCVKKILYLVLKKFIFSSFYMELGAFFKIILKLVISFRYYFCSPFKSIKAFENMTKKNFCSTNFKTD
jgi:hypothetical protein